MSNIFDLFKKIEADRAQTPTTPPTHLIVGLGNPGKEYMYTRHNAGFMALDYLAMKCNVTMDKAKFHALYADTTLGGKRVLLLKPQTYMNASGEAVRDAAEFYKIASENIFVICDDVNFDTGVLRMRKKGTDGGQKGVRSIIEKLSDDTFPRLKIGVGKKPHPEMNMADWVLSKFSKEEVAVLDGRMETIYQGVIKYLGGDADGAMQILNQKL